MTTKNVVRKLTEIFWAHRLPFGGDGLFRLATALMTKSANGNRKRKVSSSEVIKYYSSSYLLE